MAIPAGVYRFDRQDAIWVGKIAAAVPPGTLTQVHLLGQRYELMLIAGGDKGIEMRVGEFFGALRAHRPVIVNYLWDGVVAVCNARRVIVVKPPLSAQVAEALNSVPQVCVIGDLPAGVQLNGQVLKMGPVGDFVRNLRSKSVNPVDWADAATPQGQAFAVETFRGLFVRSMDCIGVDWMGAADQVWICTECPSRVSGAELLAHYATEHLSAKEFFKPMPGLAAGRFQCSLCTEKGIAAEALVAHLTVYHEDQLISKIGSLFPAAGALFSGTGGQKVLPTAVPAGRDVLLAVEADSPPLDKEVALWAKLRSTERRIGPVSLGPGETIAGLVRRLAGSSEATGA